MQRSEQKLNVHSQSNQRMQVIDNRLMLMIGRRNYSIQIVSIHCSCFCRQFAMRNQNYGGGGGSEPPLSSPAPGVSSMSSLVPVTPPRPVSEAAPGLRASPGPSSEAPAPLPPTPSLLSLHSSNPALRAAFGGLESKFLPFSTEK